MNKLLRTAPLLLMAALAACSPSAPHSTATLTIDCSKPGVELAERMYGVNLDDGFRSPPAAALLKQLAPGFARWTMTARDDADGADYRALHQWLVQCDSIGADALLVAPIEPYSPAKATLIGQAIAYATAPEATPMGRQRARQGHPAPFALRYVELAATAMTPGEYATAFNALYERLKPRFPMVSFISTLAPRQADALIHQADLTDPCHGAAEGSLWTIAGALDTLQRGRTPLCLGRYAAHATPSMAAALEEASLLAAIERNADLVALAAYGPAEAPPAAPQASQRLTGRSGSSAFARASFYVQQLFAHHQPTFNFLTTIAGQPQEAPHVSATSGYDKATGETIIKVVNASTEPFAATVTMKCEKIARSGHVVTLAAPAAEADNTPAHQADITPVATSFGGFGREFAYEFAPLSLTVMRVPTSEK